MNFKLLTIESSAYSQCTYQINKVKYFPRGSCGKEAEADFPLFVWSKHEYFYASVYNVLCIFKVVTFLSLLNPLRIGITTSA